MATPQLSPGVLVREVDLTVGRAENVLDNIGAIAGPFPIGPVEEVINITTEQQLINTFGKPLSTDAQYEYWMSASSYLSYGGILKVVRADSLELRTSNAIRNSSGISTAGDPNLKIKNFDDYEANHSDDIADYIFAAKTPGSWANDLKVCVIDDKADQIIGISTNNLSNFGAQVGYGVTVRLNNLQIPSSSGITTFNGYLKGIITGVSTSSVTSTIDVKILSRVSDSSISYSQVLSSSLTEEAASGVTTIFVSSTSGLTTSSYATITGAITNAPISGVGSTSVTLQTGIGVTVVSGTQISFSNQVSVASTEVKISYAERNQSASILANNTLYFTDNSGVTNNNTATVQTVSDWYDQQSLGLENASIYWSSIAPKPGTTQYASNRNGRSDEIHIAVVDDRGTVTGIQGNLLEKHIGLSKALDAVSASNSPQKILWKNYIASNSNYLYVGDNPSDNINPNEKVVQTGFAQLGSFAGISTANGAWNQNAQDKTFSALGNVTYNLSGGKDYTSSGGMQSTLGNLISAYNLFSNSDEEQIDYLIMGPGLATKAESQSKASTLISIANARKDCIAVISPHRGDVVDVISPETQTNNVIEFFAPLAYSSYAVFDSGYKYTYDRFNDKFRYIPCNPDVAGLMARTNLTAYPWFSPAGQQRGILNSAIKLSYNPDKSQRDRLYPLRINSIINQPGAGVILFGDKTAIGYQSAFDRINVRRLFLTVEQSLRSAAQSQLFELNNQTTRANFVNIVEPYLRDVQAKGGVYDFLVICDETNNTPDVIDNNEFRADIFLKPTKTINYVTLTFVATRTGISFEEVAGRV